MDSPPAKGPEIIRLGQNLELNARRQELRRDGRLIKLERIPMEILLILVSQEEQIVTREQIVERVWGKGVFLDTDNSINGAIRKIRQALRDDSEHPRFIQTITGKGYRFIGTVTTGEEAGPTKAPPPAAPRRVRSAWRWAAAGGALAALAVLAVYLLAPKPAAPPPNSPGRVMLAVLPFDNLTGDAAQDYFSEGLTEEMINQLGRLDPERLGVIARTSVMSYKQRRTPLEQIGRELGVQYVLDGSVRRDHGRVRVTAQLSAVTDQTQVWSGQYDREISSLLTLQGEIAREVGKEVLASLGGPPPASTVPTEVSEAGIAAHDLYLKGRYHWNKRDEQGFRKAIDHFEAAIAKDAGHARAYAGLADAYALLASYSLEPAQSVIPKARAAALKAMELDPKLAEAHTSLALIHQNYDWDWSAAEKEYRLAIQLNPNYATAHHWYAEFLGFQGRFEEALAESERARRLDPLSLIIASDHGAILMFAGQHDAAIAQLRKVLAVEPVFPRAIIIVYAYVEKGMFEEALSLIGQWKGVASTPWPWATKAYVYGRWGRQAEARQALEELETRARSSRFASTGLFLKAYAGMGMKNEAMAMLEKAHQERWNEIAVLKVDPAYTKLRDDPRFQEMLRRVGLAK